MLRKHEWTPWNETDQFIERAGAVRAGLAAHEGARCSGYFSEQRDRCLAQRLALPLVGVNRIGWAHAGDVDDSRLIASEREVRQPKPVPCRSCRAPAS